MLFFVISGFVIHRPVVEQQRFDLFSYLVRRLTRITPPILIAYAMCAIIGVEAVDALSSVMWSLYCEIAYYIAYPILLLAFRRGWTTQIYIATSILAFAILAWSGPVSYYWELPLPALILVGLPNWILGCMLAERCIADVSSAPPKESIWLWRFGAVIVSVALKAAVTHGPMHIGYPASHWILALYAFFWLDRELTLRQAVRRPSALEIAGRASFSLYLVHNPVLVIFGVLGARAESFGPGGWLTVWLLQLAAISLGTLAFYALVESPCHRLARRLGARHRSVCAV
jgi:peptidoglycan/LPS O-acetylase OafA/YrhL